MMRIIRLLCLLPLLAFTQSGVNVIPGRVSLRHFESDGVGFNGGYTTIEAMMAVPFNYQNIPFIDLRYHVFNRGRSAMNAGLGYRFNASGVLFGLNGYYDARWTTGQTFSQFGAGMEILSRFLDFRANGYFPVKYAKDVVDVKFDGFFEHGLGIKLKERLALTGGNAELGAYIGRMGQIKMYLAGGSYYFRRQECNTKIGASGRLRFSWLDNIWAQFSVQHDNLYKTNYQGTVSFSWPFWPKQRTQHWNFFPNFEALMVQPVERNDIIVLCDISRETQARDKNGEKLFIWFVDNTNVGGTGTFEDPFQMLVQAQNASTTSQYIYVFPGDGTTTDMDAGITLKSNQFLFGAGVEQLFPTSAGPVKVPAQANSTPNITNGGGVGVTLASGNVIRGFNIPSPTSSGIMGTNVGTALINQVTITGAGVDGIQIDPSSGTSNIAIVDCTCSGSTMNGINLSPSGTSTMNATVQNSTLNSNAGNGLLLMAAGTSTVTFSANNNTINSNTLNGINLSATGTSLTGTIDSNTLNTNMAIGVNVVAGSSVLGQLTVSNNTVTMSGGSGMNFASSNASLFNTTFNANTINTPGASGIVVSATNTSGPTVTITGNAINTATTQGISLSSSSTSPGLTAILTNNTVNVAGDNGLAITAGGIMNITASGNTIFAPTTDGIAIAGAGSATLTATFTGTSISTSPALGYVNGVSIGSTAGSRTYNLTFNGTTITGNANTTGNAMIFVAEDSNIFNLTVSNNNNITNFATGAAISGSVAGGSPTVNLTVSGNDNFTGNSSGIVIVPSDSSTFTTAITSNTINSTTSADLSYGAFDTSANQLSVTDNSFSDSVVVTTHDTSTLCLIMSNNSATTYALTNLGVANNFTVQSSDAPNITGMQSSNTGTFSPLTPAGVLGVTSCSP